MLLECFPELEFELTELHRGDVDAGDRGDLFDVPFTEELLQQLESRLS